MSTFFNAHNVEPNKAQDTLPPGWYPCTVAEVEYKATKGRNPGKGINFDFKVISGEHAGQHVFQFVNVENSSEKAQDIGQRELSAICHATGLFILDTPEAIKGFKGRNLMVRVTWEKQTKEQEEAKEERKNKVSGVKPMEGASLATPGVPGIPSVPSAAPAIPSVPSVPAVPAAPVATPVIEFPPAGWQAHPTPGYFHNGVEVLTEADLRARITPAAPAVPAVPAVPSVPVIPAAPPVPAPTPLPPPPAAPAWPPAGWQAHPTPGYFHNGTEVLTEADLKARFTTAAVPAAPAVPGIPAVPTTGAAPAAAGGSDVPPWDR